MSLDNYALWQGGGGKITATNGLNTGSQIEATFQYMGKEHVTVAEVLENDGASRYRVKSLQGPLTYLVTYQLVEEGTATRLTIDSEGEMGTLLKLAEPVIKYMSETRQESNLKILKSVLEGQVTEVAA